MSYKQGRAECGERGDVVVPVVGSARALGACRVLYHHFAVGQLQFGLLVFLQWNTAIKLLCNDVDVVLVYLVDSDVLVCCDVR